MAVSGRMAHLPPTVERVASSFGRQPHYIVSGASGDQLYAAKWTLPESAGGWSGPEHILSCHLEGTTSVSKVIDRKVVGRRAAIGSVNFTSGDEGSHWVLGGDLTVMIVYMHPTLLRGFCDQYARSGHLASIDPFFAIQDPWLKGYFQMLISEVEIYSEPAAYCDSILLEQSQQLLMRHLVSRHSNLDRTDLRRLEAVKLDHALQPLLLKRVVDFVLENLSTDIHLGHLAGLVHQSEYHFIRAFHAATGTTPYQFVLEKRLHTAAQLLRTGAISVGEIAGRVGFKSASYFSAKFRAYYGLTPTRYRQTGRS
jgi:AraC family transcriptional regulator